MTDFPTLPTKHYRELRHEVRSGDILLCSGNSVFSRLIQHATGSVWSHVAFILRVDPIDRIMVLESVESIGVRAIPLSNYVSDYNATRKGYPGRIMLARHADVKSANINQLSTAAVDFLGYPYGTDEIVRIAARIGMQTMGMSVHDALAPQHEFICSEYAHACFKSVGVDIEGDDRGFIAPADFARHPKVSPICYVRTETDDATCAPIHDARHAVMS